MSGIPCTGHLDHLHQKSYVGPPIHQVIQILTTINLNNINESMRHITHHCKLPEQNAMINTCTVVPIVVGGWIIHALINNILGGSFIVHGINLFKGSSEMHIRFHALDLQVKSQTLNNPPRGL